MEDDVRRHLFCVVVRARIMMMMMMMNDATTVPLQEIHDKYNDG
jgi:hypothetical protein